MATLGGGDDGINVTGTEDDDLVNGGAGDDVLRGMGGDDTIEAGAGDDKVRGGTGNDDIDGGEGKDKLHGGQGDDVLDGGAGNDRLFGGEGDDTLIGGSGNDLLKGDGGKDTFSFEGDNTGKDVISDFNVNQDILEISSDLAATKQDVLKMVEVNDKGDVVIDLGDGNSITLKGVSQEQFEEHYEKFVHIES